VLFQHELVLFQHEFSCYCIENLSTRIFFNTLAISNTGILSVWAIGLVVNEHELVGWSKMMWTLDTFNFHSRAFERLTKVDKFKIFSPKIASFSLVSKMAAENQRSIICQFLFYLFLFGVCKTHTIFLWCR
jgi:hypothetical protein